MSVNRAVYRIMSGTYRVKVDNTLYIIESPTADILYEAELYYEELLNENRFEFWPTDKDTVKLLIEGGTWTAESDANLTKLEEQIDEYKHNAYLNYAKMNFLVMKDNKKLIKQCKEKWADMKNRRSKYYDLTLEGYAEIQKQQFILGKCIQGRNALDSPPFSLLQNLRNKINEQSEGIESLRKISRTDPWKSIWGTAQGNVALLFANKMLNEEQKTLVSYSHMYDNIHKHQECPPSMVLEDDDLLDGWMIEQRKIREKESKQNKNTPKSIGKNNKMDKAQDVFIIARNKEEAKEINDMNDSESKYIKAEREAAIKKHGVLKEVHLPDKKRELVTKVTEMFKDQVKGKK